MEEIYSYHGNNRISKNINFPSWFPEFLKEKMSQTKSNILEVRLDGLPLRLVKAYFESYELKSYWMAINRRIKNKTKNEIAVLLSIPMLIFKMSTMPEYSYNNTLKKSEYKDKMKKIGDLANQLEIEINNYGCDLYLPYLFVNKSSKENEINLNNEDIYSFLNPSSNKFRTDFSLSSESDVRLSTLLKLLQMGVEKASEIYEPINLKPGAKNPKELFFVKSLQREFLRTYDQPFHEHTRDLCNEFFGTNYSKDNIASITKDFRPNIEEKKFYNDATNWPFEVVHKILDQYYPDEVEKIRPDKIIYYYEKYNQRVSKEEE